MNYSIKPEQSNRKEAEKVIENVLNVANSVIDEVPNVTASFAWVPENREHGEAWSSDYLHLLFNDEAEDWDKRLEASTWRSIFEAYFYKHSQTDLHWQILLKNAFAILHASKYAESIPWKEDLVEVQNWKNIRKQVKKGEVSEEDWIEAASAFYRILESMDEEKNLAEMTELNRSQILNRGDSLFEE